MVLIITLAFGQMSVLKLNAADNSEDGIAEIDMVTEKVTEEEELEWTRVGDVAYMPEGITRIEEKELSGFGGVNTIEEFQGVKKLVLPSTLEYIGNKAFEMCKLEEIVIPGNVKEIGDDAFWACDNLKKVTIEDGVEKIGSCLFCNCENLETVIMPQKVKEWDTSSAFMWCYSLKNITLPEEGMDSMGTGMFYSCKSLEELIIPDCVTTMNYGVISACDNLKLLKAGKNVVNFEKEEEPYPYSAVNFTLGCFGFCSSFVLEAPIDSAIVEYARTYRYFTVKYDYPDFERMEWICDGKIPEDETSKWVTIQFTWKEYPENTRTGGCKQIDLTKNVLQKDGYSCVWISSTDIQVDWAADGRGVPAVHYFSETYTTQDENLEYTVEHTDYFRIIVTETSLSDKRIQIEILTSGTWDSEDAEWELITPAIDTVVLTPVPTQVPQVTSTVTTEPTMEPTKVPEPTKVFYQDKEIAPVVTKKTTPIPTVKEQKPVKVSLKSAKQITVKKQGKKTYKREVKLSWKKAKNVDGYVIYMKTGKGKYKAVKTIRNEKTANYTKKNLKKGKTYYFKIRAYRKVNGQKVYGNYSSVRKIKLK